MNRAVVFSGGQDYTDPWHPFVETSAVVADILRRSSFEVEVILGVADLEQTLRDGDVLVINAGGGQQAHPKDDHLRSVIAAHRGGLLALHVASTLLPGDDFWEGRLGGRWVRGHTMHPARGEMRLLRTAGVDEDLPSSIDTVDEAYSWLRVDQNACILYQQLYDGQMHPVVWTYASSAGRSAYCAVGHDVEAYDAPAVGNLVVHLARWVGIGAPSGV